MYFTGQDIQDVVWARNCAGWSCYDCKIKFRDNENIVEVHTRTHMMGTHTKYRMCMACGEVAISEALDGAKQLVEKAKKDVDRMKEMMQKCKLSVRKRQHIFIGRQLSEGK